MAVHAFTCIVANYLPKARVLAKSLKHFHPEIVFHLVLADAVPGFFDLAQEPFDDLITVDKLGLKNPNQWLFKHSVVEASTGVKAFALVNLLELADCSEVLYLDPDIVVLASLEGLLGSFGDDSLLLTPHLTEPETSHEAIVDNEISALKHGTYNLGFLGVKASEDGRRFARWWRDRLEKYCRDDIPNGLFTDQRWVDLVPGCFSGVRILRDPVYNVCTWNLTSRRIEGSLADGLRVGGEPVVFFHFSGIDSGAQQAMLDKYGAAMRGLYELREWYLAECERMGQTALGRLPWAFDCFDNGQPVTAAQRRIYRDRPELEKLFPNPFSTADRSQSFYHWFQSANHGPAAPVLSGSSRPDSVLKNQGQITPPTTGVAEDMELLEWGRAVSPAFQPEYRVFLSVTREDRDLAAATARNLLAVCAHRKSLYLVGTDAALATVARDPEIEGRFERVDPGAAGHAASFERIVRDFGDRDFLFVTPGVVLPEFGDLRLAWTAWSEPGIASVSPISDLAPETSLDPPGELLTERQNPEARTEALDRLCRHFSRFAVPVLDGFCPACFFVSAAALNRIRLGPGTVNPRGFLESTRADRWSHVLADHVYVGSSALRPASQPHATKLPELADLASEIRGHLASAGSAEPLPVRAAARSRRLHITHGWGGGLDRWIQEFCLADRHRDSFVLRPFHTPNAYGAELRLYRQRDGLDLIRSWPMTPPIKATSITHEGYAAVLSEILEEFGIDTILVSSFIGHSLDVLRMAIRTIVVCHDYYPFCPAISITFGSTCRECGPDRLAECARGNPLNRFFWNMPAAAWNEMRSSFLKELQRRSIPLVAPSPSVLEHYRQLAPQIANQIRVIPHGSPRLGSGPLALSFDSTRRLRVLVLGYLAPEKGLDLLRAVAGPLVQFADLFLVGCGRSGSDFGGRDGVTVIRSYELADLPGILQEFSPDVALLLSVLPETYSYVLQELMDLGIPPLATRLGAFADRIQHGVNGLLCEPSAEPILDQLKSLSSDRTTLARIHAALASAPRRSLIEMREDYDELIGLPVYSSRAYFCPDSRVRKAKAGFTCARLYWGATGGEFDSARSAASKYELGPEPQEIRLPIPAWPYQNAHFRLVLSERVGFLELNRLSVKDWRGRAVWSWDSRRGPLAGAKFHGLIVLTTGGPGGLLYMASDEPSIDFQLTDEACRELVQGGWLECGLRTPTPEEVMPSVAALVDGGSGPVPAETRECLHRMVTLVTRRDRGRSISASTQAWDLDRGLAVARRRVADLEHSLSWRVTAPLRFVGGLGLRLMRLIRRR